MIIASTNLTYFRAEYLHGWNTTIKNNWGREHKTNSQRLRESLWNVVASGKVGKRRNTRLENGRGKWPHATIKFGHARRHVPDLPSPPLPPLPTLSKAWYVGRAWVRGERLISPIGVGMKSFRIVKFWWKKTRLGASCACCLLGRC